MLEVKNLKTYFYLEDAVVKAVDGVSFEVNEGENFGIVGESGSGKSTVAYSILRLVDIPGKIVGGEILFDGKNLLALREGEMQKIRGAKISMVFQDPFTALNPVLTIGEQIAEAIRFHQGLSHQDAEAKTIEMLELVHIKNAKERFNAYPHQFSGGMQQRVVIAMALACKPKLLIADEPTTALDVTIQAEILQLIKELQQKMKLSIIFVTHNFGIVANFCNRVAVMYKGKIVEEGATRNILSQPQHIYTKQLISAIPKIK
ncbi:MAG: ABC transporter ATP-binding protein [Candidatus Saganbacteria bacterium]|nr:ABC transporter ATP-binding protein [Candidatus Saganbacteria bacterium]